MDSDNARFHGEITLTDLAQSELLAGAKANLIKAKTELLTLNKLWRVTRESSPSTENLNEIAFLTLLNSWRIFKLAEMKI